MRYILLAVSYLLASCTASAPDSPPAVLSQPLDAAVQQQAEAQQLAALLDNGKLKVKGGTVIIQLGGAGNVASPADNRKAGQRQGSAATAPAASSSNQSKRTGGTPWWVWGLVAALGAAGWEWLRKKLLG